MIFNKIFKQRYSCWDQVENAIEQIEITKEKGDAFEQFAFAYFTYFKDIYQIESLYMGPDIPEQLKASYKLEKKDSGVDGLYLKEDGTSVAYQVKFRTGAEAPSYDDLTSFWAESEHTTERCIFANCYTLPKQAYKKKDQFVILRDSLVALNDEFYEWLYQFANTGDTTTKQQKYSPKEHQHGNRSFLFYLRKQLKRWSRNSVTILLTCLKTTPIGLPKFKALPPNAPEPFPRSSKTSRVFARQCFSSANISER